MQITLDKPTFLTSLTEEKPEQNQTDSPGGGLDFLTTMMQQAANTVSENEVPVETPLLTDEQSSPPVDLQLDELSNFLIEMGYLTNVVPATPELTKSADLTQTLDDKTNQLDAYSKQRGVSSQFEVGSEASPSLQQVIAGERGVNSQGNMNDLKSAMKPIHQAGNERINSLSSQVKSDGTNLGEGPEAELLAQGASSASSVQMEAMSVIQANKAENMKGPERVQSPSKDGRSVAETNNKSYNNKSLSELMSKKLTDMTEATVSNTVPAQRSTPGFVETTPDQKVVNTLNQMAAWLQTKVDAEPKLKMGVNTPLTDTNFLLTKQSLGGAATPARAAFEARVEMNQVMSGAELNLATYHANIKIYPPELGKVTAKLKMDKNIATLEVTAANKEVKALLQTHINSLREQFAGSNIHLDKIDIILAPAKDPSTTNSDGRREDAKEDAEIDQEEVLTQKATASKTSKKASNNTVDAYV